MSRAPVMVEIKDKQDGKRNLKARKFNLSIFSFILWQTHSYLEVELKFKCFAAHILEFDILQIGHMKK